MNAITEEIFKNRIFNAQKLCGYGFEFKDGFYCLDAAISDGQFRLKIKISENGIYTEVVETDTGEPYTLFLVEDAEGSFVGAIRAEYRQVLTEIADACFDKYAFRQAQSEQVISYVREKYGDEPEFLWEKFTDNAVFRRKDNKKWYAAILTVAPDKLFLSGKKEEILDLRADPELIENTVDNEKFFRGYHMNKKHWISLRLDGAIPIGTVFEMIDNSFALANKK